MIRHKYLWFLWLALFHVSGTAYAAEGSLKSSGGFDWLLLRDIGVVIIAGILMYYLKRGKKEKPKEKAVDWFKPKEIDEDGFIVTDDDRYMMMLRVQPISFILKSPQEQRAIWLTFREWLSMLSHPVRFRIESHPYDLQEYFHDLRSKAIEMGDVLNIQYVKEQEDVFNQVIQDQKIQDQQCFLVLETDYRFMDELAGAVTNPLISDVLQKFRKGQQSDYREIAKQELLNSLRVTQSTFSNIKLYTAPMNRKDVKNYLNGSINREVSGLVSLDEFVQRVGGVGEDTVSLMNMQVRSGQHVLEKGKAGVTA
ncbi:PHB domain-containing protein [Brevibacillus sp. IT-7CA2]